ncbi:uncharacterized protein BDZ99DRAFT_390849 [Mytilinidion resinicola]|uniref:Glutaredoxin-like protein n=1 Tax=Mytilinidion resinicola TaxID=574789 RepID=A0A6A6YIY9_9PEZI|nr:uncharacterized protein BDZ99DRAFT_390849 [Mytilinidion resinicola]KAF2808518.1 hypothetical protein BDZ99DRAFT_390849 [Mytilinidion resinicola]
MLPSRRLLQHASKITLFTRANCSLCDSAKRVLSDVWDQRPFEYTEIDVMEPGKEKWKIYEFDTPVIHVDKFRPGEETTTGAVLKLMHRFKEAEVKSLMDEAEEDKNP